MLRPFDQRFWQEAMLKADDGQLFLIGTDVAHPTPQGEPDYTLVFAKIIRKKDASSPIDPERTQ